MTFLSPSIVTDFLIGIGTSIGGRGICAITYSSSYGFNLEIWEAKDIYPSVAFCSPEAIRCKEASMSIAFVSAIHVLSSKLSSIQEVEFSVSAVVLFYHH